MKTLLRRQRERDEASTVVKRERGKASTVVKRERGIKRERTRERSATVSGVDGDDDGVSFVSAKRRRQLPVILNEDGTETIDLT
jgi:hypothetical protein